MVKDMEVIRKLILLTCFIFSSCSYLEDKNENVKKILSYYSNENNNLKTVEISREDIQDINYPLIKITTNNVINQTVMLPISTRGRYSNFISAKKQSITLNGTLITKTIGFNANLVSLSSEEKSPLIIKTKPELWPKSLKRSYSFLTPTYKTEIFLVDCKIELKSIEEKKILKNEIKTLTKFNEYCTGDKITFTNQYWVDEEGFIWLSRQWISPKNIFANLTVLKL